MSDGRVQSGAVLDAARGLAMTGVIYAHTLELFSDGRKDGLWVDSAFVQGAFLASFIVPLFYLVSGVAMAKVEMKSPRGVLKTSLQLVLFAYLANFMAVPLKVALLLATESPEVTATFLKNTAIDFARGNFVLVGPVWFLLVLAVGRLALYLIARTIRGGAFWVMAFAVLLLTLASAGMPSAFHMRSWAPALLFMMLGYGLAPCLTRVPWPAAIPAGLAAWFLAPLNRGCAFDAAAACPLLHESFFVHFPTGHLGYLPLFYVTALLGIVMVLGLSTLLARTGVKVFAAIGRSSLQLLVIHGAIQGFTFSFLASLPLPPLNPVTYLAMIVAEMMLLMQLVHWLREPLKWMLRSSLTWAGWLTDRIAVPAARGLHLHVPTVR